MISVKTECDNIAVKSGVKVIILQVNTMGMEERPPIWRVAVKKLNMQQRTADEGWSSSLGVGRGYNNPSP
jgi:hypothetical protein